MTASSDDITVVHFSICNCTEYKHTIAQKEYDLKRDPSSDSFSVTVTESQLVSKHLLIKLEKVSLDNKGKAIALSYTWGEFPTNQSERKKVPIGHLPASAKTKYLELGEEWDIPEMLDRLVEICTEYGGIWMDQLSMSQDNMEERAKVLKLIPDIFSTLEVLVLMPGSTCLCLKYGLGLLDPKERESHGGVPRWANFMNYIVPRYLNFQWYFDGMCLNSWGISSWHNRIWTFQEGRHARKTKIVWNLKTKLSCAHAADISATSLNNLNRYAKLWLIDRNSDRKGVIASIMTLFWESKGHRVAMLTLANKTCLKYYGRIPDRYSPVLDLMYGETIPRKDMEKMYGWETCRNLVEGQAPTESSIANGNGAPEDGDAPVESIQQQAQDIIIKRDIWDLWESIGVLGAAERSATRPRDYILALWVKLPGYEQPQNVWKMKAAHILEDAILQLEKRNATLLCSAASGLFSVSNASATPATTGLWRPTLYIGVDDKDIKTSYDLYGSIQLGEPIFTFNGRIPFKTRSGTSLTHQTSTYEDMFLGFSTKEIFLYNFLILENTYRWVHPRLTLWNNNLFLPKQYISIHSDALFRGAFDELTTALPTYPLQMQTKIKEFLYLYAITASPLSGLSYKIFDLAGNIDHHAVMYKLTCYMLGVREDICRKNNLELVVAWGGDPIIGLRKKGLTHTDEDLIKTKTLTLLSSHTKRKLVSPAMALLEVREVDVDRKGEEPKNCKPNYEVIGTWAPAKKMKAEALGGEAIPWRQFVTEANIEPEVNAWLIN